MYVKWWYVYIIGYKYGKNLALNMFAVIFSHSLRDDL